MAYAAVLCFHEGYFTRSAELTGICELEERVEQGDADESHHHQSQIQQGESPNGGKEGFNVTGILIQLLGYSDHASISRLVSRQQYADMTCSTALYDDL